ncbi:hypothetical protein [Streptomyces sp. SYSU K217416]
MADHSPTDRKNTPAGPAVRGLWIAGGAALIVLSCALLFYAQTRSDSFSDDMRLYLTLLLRGGFFLVLSAGAYCVVRGWNRR